MYISSFESYCRFEKGCRSCRIKECKGCGSPLGCLHSPRKWSACDGNATCTTCKTPIHNIHPEAQASNLNWNVECALEMHKHHITQVCDDPCCPWIIIQFHSLTSRNANLHSRCIKVIALVLSKIQGTTNCVAKQRVESFFLLFHWTSAEVASRACKIPWNTQLSTLWSDFNVEERKSLRGLLSTVHYCVACATR